MSDAPPPLHPLLSPDGIAGMALAALGGLITAFHERVRAFGMFIGCLTSSLVTAVAVPIMKANGFTWADWLGVGILGCAVVSTAAFLVALSITNHLRMLAEERSKGVAGLIFDILIGRWLPKKGG